MIAFFLSLDGEIKVRVKSRQIASCPLIPAFIKREKEFWYQRKILPFNCYRQRGRESEFVNGILDSKCKVKGT
jgi:hypothetical protein